MAKRADIYGGIDPSELPLYSVPEAARILKLPSSTLRDWVMGGRYITAGGVQESEPVVQRPPGESLLTFSNLVEAHLLATITRKHDVALQKVRPALHYVRDILGVERPLLAENFQTDGRSLFVERYGKLVNASEAGQLGMAKLLSAALERVERGPNGIPIALYPWRIIREQTAHAPKPIVVDPRQRFGAPVLRGSGVPVEVIVDRWQAGDRLSDVADDFGVDRDLVEDAARWWGESGSRAAH